MATLQTHYDTLQVSNNASDAVIRAAYKSLSQKYHPDKNRGDRVDADDAMKTINAAYVVLSDSAKRMEYDAWLLAKQQSSTAHEPIRNRVTPPEPQSPHRAPSRSFLKRTWFMLLFVAAVAMLLGGLPYVVWAGEFKWTYVAGVAFWLGVGHYAYGKLFASTDA